jgi:hypothetical protein
LPRPKAVIYNSIEIHKPDEEYGRVLPYSQTPKKQAAIGLIVVNLSGLRTVPGRNSGKPEALVFGTEGAIPRTMVSWARERPEGGRISQVNEQRKTTAFVVFLFNLQAEAGAAAQAIRRFKRKGGNRHANAAL